MQNQMLSLEFYINYEQPSLVVPEEDVVFNGAGYQIFGIHQTWVSYRYCFLQKICCEKMIKERKKIIY